MQRNDIETNILQLIGMGNSDTGIRVLELDNNNLVNRASGTAANVPSGKSGYAMGCFYTATDNGAQYRNTGSTTSCTFTLVGTVADASITLAKLDAPTAAKVNNMTITNIGDGAAMTATAAQMLGGILTMTPTTARNIQLDTAANIIAAVSGMVAGGWFDLTIVNEATDGSLMTVTTNTGLTLVGNMVVGAAAAAGSGTFRVTMTGAGAVSIVRK